GCGQCRGRRAVASRHPQSRHAPHPDEGLVRHRGGLTMIPRAFEYFSPTSLEEVVSLLSQHGDDAKVLAGGHSLLPLMKLRLASPEVLVDIGRLPGLSSVTEHDGGCPRRPVASTTRSSTVGPRTGPSSVWPRPRSTVGSVWP